jgi:hypothetical protein
MPKSRLNMVLTLRATVTRNLSHSVLCFALSRDSLGGVSERKASPRAQSAKGGLSFAASAANYATISIEAEIAASHICHRSPENYA